MENSLMGDCLPDGKPVYICISIFKNIIFKLVFNFFCVEIKNLGGWRQQQSNSVLLFTEEKKGGERRKGRNIYNLALKNFQDLKIQQRKMNMERK